MELIKLPELKTKKNYKSECCVLADNYAIDVCTLKEQTLTLNSRPAEMDCLCNRICLTTIHEALFTWKN
jgi:hypothetical protein